jgi:MinD superfamily P-loop ATPase
MKIAIVSGKGGAGKTTVATNLAYLAARRGLKVSYLDCDVEEPNGSLFLRPDKTTSSPIGLLVPRVDQEMCSLCGRCESICRFSAIVCLGNQVLVYPEMCHSCGGCFLVCRDRAITETFRETGKLETGIVENINVITGRMNVGEALSPPLIREVKKAAPDSELEIRDAPPGTSCPAVETILGTDFVLLVAEPTPFGFHDFKIAAEMLQTFGLPFSAVINRAGVGDNSIHSFCQQNQIEILETIPDNRKVAESYSRGLLACREVPQFHSLISNLLDKILVIDSMRLQQKSWALDTRSGCLG